MVKTVAVLALDVAGLAFIAGAGYVLWLWLGLLLTGIALVVLSWMIAADEAS